MRRLARYANDLVSRLSPGIAEHSRYLVMESYIAVVHTVAARRCMRAHREAKGLRLNVGCGHSTKPGFLNLDFSSSADVRLDLRRSIPLPDASCSLVHSEHFVEHLSYPEGAEQFYSECFRILEPDGEVSVSVPDTAWPLSEYVQKKDSWLKACAENKWHPEECSTFMEHINYDFRQRWRDVSFSHFDTHRFAWDFETMEKKLTEAGFVDVRRREYDPHLDSAHRRVGSLFVMATKPRNSDGVVEHDAGPSGHPSSTAADC